MKWLLSRLERKRVWIPLAVLLAFLVYGVAINWFSLTEGVPYLLDGLAYEPASDHPVTADGPFHLAHQLVVASSLARMEIIATTLTADGVRFEALPVDRGYKNIFVPGLISGSFVLVEAHYDKQIDDPSFQAATDNTGSVAVLLAAIHEMKDELPTCRIGFLFTALEEQGLVGARYFVRESRRRGMSIAQAVCMDGIGRGSPLLMTPAERAGFRFSIPFYRSVLYDGRSFGDDPAKHAVDAAQLPPPLRGLKVQHAFLSCTDADAFLEFGMRTCHIAGGNMWHLDQTWGRYSDTLERLDELDLQETKALVVSLVRYSRLSEANKQQ
jgi:hypothetical protein